VRVAFIVPKFPNISETFILDEIVGLLRLGHDVDIYAMHRGAATDIHPAYVQFGLQSRTVYCYPAVGGRLGQSMAIAGAVVKMLSRNPGALLACARSRKPGMQSMAFVILAHAIIESRRQYDVVHAHFGPSGIRAEVVRRAKVFDAPIVTTFHGYDVTSFVARNGPTPYAGLAQTGDCFIAVSESIAHALKIIGIPESRTRIMPLGVDCNIFSPDGSENHSGGTARVLSIGRLVEKKGLEFGIRAVAEARRRGANLSYEIIGDGHLRTELEAIATHLDIRDAVVFHGSKNQTEVRALLKKTDIVLVPSVTAASGDQESMPIVVKEAMAQALPVVASRHAGIPEIITHGETGLLVAERDYAGLADHLIVLARDPAERLRLGRAGRALVERAYSNERLVDDLAELYRALAVRTSENAPSEIRASRSVAP
jgi:colanic acid/amylovoran biosynthesis glycosyltransferase